MFSSESSELDPLSPGKFSSHVIGRHPLRNRSPRFRSGIHPDRALRPERLAQRNRGTGVGLLVVVAEVGRLLVEELARRGRVGGPGTMARPARCWLRNVRNRVAGSCAKRWPPPVKFQGLNRSKFDCSSVRKPTMLSIELKPRPTPTEPVAFSSTSTFTSR